MEDAEWAQMEKLAKVISTGDDTPGVILENTTVRFREIFNQADVIIAKGQGNFESLNELDRNIFFLLMVKCKHVADQMHAKIGDFVIKSNS